MSDICWHCQGTGDDDAGFFCLSCDGSGQRDEYCDECRHLEQDCICEPGDEDGE